MQLSARILDEDGMTLIEVMVAMVVLVIGILGVTTMLNTSNGVTRDNLARDGATGLAREQLERVRDMTYANLATPATIAAALAPALGNSTTPTIGTFTTTRRNVTYTTTITSCVLDDPSDGIGPVAGTPCKVLPPGGGGVPGPAIPVVGTGSSLNLKTVLGISLTGTGSIVDAVCALVGKNSILDGLIGQSGTLSGLVTSGADVGVCSSGTQVTVDRQPSDATAVTSTVSWTQGRASSITQRTVVSGPRVAQS